MDKLFAGIYCSSGLKKIFQKRKFLEILTDSFRDSKSIFINFSKNKLVNPSVIFIMIAELCLETCF